MTEDYPVFRKWSDTLDWILDTVEKYPKTVRFTISSRITEISINTIELLVEAIYERYKINILKQTNLNIEKLRVFFRISYNRKYISVRQYEYISRELNEVGAMIGGWMKQSRSERYEESK